MIEKKSHKKKNPDRPFLAAGFIIVAIGIFMLGFMSGNREAPVKSIELEEIAPEKVKEAPEQAQESKEIQEELPPPTQPEAEGTPPDTCEEKKTAVERDNCFFDKAQGFIEPDMCNKIQDLTRVKQCFDMFKIK